MAKLEPIKSGDSVALSYAPKPDQDITPWACSVVVKPQADKEAAALITLQLPTASSDGKARIGLLVTASLDPGDYHICARLVNSTTQESREIHDRLIVETSAF